MVNLMRLSSSLERLNSVRKPILQAYNGTRVLYFMQVDKLAGGDRSKKQKSLSKTVGQRCARPRQCDTTRSKGLHNHQQRESRRGAEI